jgi:hypothetical protein
MTLYQEGTGFMDKIFFVIALIAMLGVIFSFLGGMFAMTRGTKKDHQMSQKMMQMRVLCQGIALACLFLAYLAKH